MVSKQFRPKLFRPIDLELSNRPRATSHPSKPSLKHDNRCPIKIVNSPIAFNLKLLSYAIVLGCSSPYLAAEYPPPPPVYSPEEQLGHFQFAEEGYRIELVASEPMIEDPVAIRFDGEGRLWVVEMKGYMQDIDRSGVNDPIGRVSVLEDTNGDGAMDKRTVFLDNLVLPRSVAIHPDGVLVAENKPLWFVRDTDGDLVADQKIPVDPNYAQDNVEHSSNGLYRAMDNWIYNAKEGHRYRREGDQWIRDETEARGQWGICQDDFGRLIYNYNHSQLHGDLVPPNTLTRNPNHKPSTGLSVGITSTNAVFPIRPNLASNRGYIPGALDEQGRIQEFTSACAPLVYRGDLFSEFSGDAFVCEPVGNLIKRSKLSNSGGRITGQSVYPDLDFLTSTDERFRPCWIANGPDGALYIADMYRGIVQDGIHMSPYFREISIARKMDTPIHLGRIWRIVPDAFEQPNLPSFSTMSAVQLVETLAHPSGWWRDQAQMYLVERDLRTAIPDLQKIVFKSENQLARLHALWTLEGLRAPHPESLIKTLHDPTPAIQAAGLRVLHSLGIDHSVLASHIEALAQESLSPQFRLQSILTLGNLNISHTKRFDTLKSLILSHLDDPLIRDATLSSLANSEANFLHALWAELPDSLATDSGTAFIIESLSQAVGKSRNAPAIETLLSFLDSPNPNGKQRAVLAGLEIHATAFSRSPVALNRKPVAANHHRAMQSYFSWPGHTPAYSPQADTRPLTPNEQVLFARGRQVYLTSCVACHGGDGQGMNLLAPPLAGSDWVVGNPERLARVLFHGLTGPITVSGKRYAAPDVQPIMPPLANLSNSDTASVLTYIRREWGNGAEPIEPGRIGQLRIQAQGRTVPWTEEELEPFSNPNPE